MELLAAVPLAGPVLATIVGTVIPFLVVLGVVVFVHEYGHYIVGRWCGIHAEAFSVGFGKELYGWTDRRGTRWRVAALPLGGYVKFLGDADAASANADAEALAGMSAEDRGRAFPTAALWRRAATVSAGPVANFILSAVIFAMMAFAMGLPTDRAAVGRADPGQALQAGDVILSVDGAPVQGFGAALSALSVPGQAVYDVVVERDGARVELVTGAVVPPVVDGVSPGSPADKAGLEPGDRIAAVGGQPVAVFADLQRAVGESGEGPVTLTVHRGTAAPFDVEITPMITVAPGPDGGTVTRPLIGVTAATTIDAETRTPGPVEAVSYGAERTYGVIASSLGYIGAMVTGQADSAALGGPIRIAEMSGQAADAGLASFVGMIALISASIGMINLFPVPVLDGGHLVFYAVEAVRGRPLGERAMEAATGVGLGLVILLMVFVTWNDISSL